MSDYVGACQRLAGRARQAAIFSPFVAVYNLQYHAPSLPITIIVPNLVFCHNFFYMELEYVVKPDVAAQKPTYSKEQPIADTESEAAAQGEEKSENIHGLNRIRFALLFTCILLGSFFIGYVRIFFLFSFPELKFKLMFICRIPAVLQH